MRNRVKCLIHIIVIFYILLAALPVTAVTITGVVTVNNEIITDEETVYVIEGNAKGAELSEYIGELVNVNGAIKDVDDVKIIKISNFSMLIEPDEPFIQEPDEMAVPESEENFIQVPDEPIETDQTDTYIEETIAPDSEEVLIQTPDERIETDREDIYMKESEEVIDTENQQ